MLYDFIVKYGMKPKFHIPDDTLVQRLKQGGGVLVVGTLQLPLGPEYPPQQGGRQGQSQYHKLLHISSFFQSLPIFFSIYFYFKNQICL